MVFVAVYNFVLRSHMCNVFVCYTGQNTRGFEYRFPIVSGLREQIFLIMLCQTKPKGKIFDIVFGLYDCKEWDLCVCLFFRY